jgi:chromosome segregation ATPase
VRDSRDDGIVVVRGRLGSAVAEHFEAVVNLRITECEGRIGEGLRRIDRLESQMDRIDGRLDRLEQRVDDGFRKVDARFAQVDARFAQINARFDQVDARFDKVDARLETVPLKETIETAVERVVDSRFDRLENLLTCFLGLPGSPGGAKA